MGGQGGPLWRKITYRLPTPATTSNSSSAGLPETDIAHAETSTHLYSNPFPTTSVQLPVITSPTEQAGTIIVDNGMGLTTTQRVPFFTYLRQLRQTHGLYIDPETAAQLPFNFWGGLVGYLGYELKAECGGHLAHPSTTPDASLFFADRVVAIDHLNGDVYLLAVHEQQAASQLSQTANGCRPGEQGMSVAESANQWLDDMQEQIRKVMSALHSNQSSASTGNNSQPKIQLVMPTSIPSVGPETVTQSLCRNTQVAEKAAQSAVMTACQTEDRNCPATQPCEQCLSHKQLSQLHPGHSSSITTAKDLHVSTPAKQAIQPFRLRHNKQRYKANIEAVDRALHAGDTYEVCLTTALVRQGAPHPPTIYKTLRQLNPAPYAAWLNYGASGPIVCCSSPERFLRGDRGGVLEARPIKGTIARNLKDALADKAAAQQLAASEKDRAENLMIVDLLRNDLGAVCEVGSVHVPGLMEIESYATVHQMVSTVRGVRKESATLTDCIQAAFPAGSMTGAPKVRTMQIIDELEGCARGIYSGCIGFISLNDCFDLNVVIRTLVIEPGTETLESTGRAAMNGLSLQDQAALRNATLSIGAGGAVVVQSDAEAEFAEMRLKARALLSAIGMCDGTDGPASLDDSTPL